MKQLTPILLFIASCGAAKIRPDTETGKKLWRLDTCIVDSETPICLFQQGKDSYVYRNDTCYYHNKNGFTAIYIRIKK